MENERKLANLLKEVANWPWDRFVVAENDMTYSTSDSIIFSLIRACAMENLSAIKLAINRVDGKLVTPVQIVYPKLYYLYPNAKEIAAGESVPQLAEVETTEVKSVATVEVEQEEMTEEDLPTLTFRQTLDKMTDYPRSLPPQIIKAAQAVDQNINKVKNPPPMPENIPAVKSVVAAHLLAMAQRRDIDALTEVFDSLDGKLVETLQIIGEDIYISQFSTVAPVGAIRNNDGVYQIEAKEAQGVWTTKLGGKNE